MGPGQKKMSPADQMSVATKKRRAKQIIKNRRPGPSTEIVQTLSTTKPRAALLLSEIGHVEGHAAVGAAKGSLAAAGVPPKAWQHCLSAAHAPRRRAGLLLRHAMVRVRPLTR